ncbi:MAG TPA: Rieske (2Fe-2S) protein [Ktedonobacteraceae bacterium]|nr:Rieske (2Fe-2S) protein [Ktedonobacteraceae bacterium]
MQGDDQERFEDYLELEQFIEELQAGHAAHPPAELTPEKANIYRMAALFRSAFPDAAEPRPEFAADLHARLTEEIQQKAEKRNIFSFLRKKQEQTGSQRAGGTSGGHERRQVSRRTLLAGGAAVAASLVAGAGIMHEVDQAAATPQATVTGKTWKEPLIAAAQPTTWYYVTTLAELGNKVVRFATDTIVGYVTFDDTKGDPDEGSVIAMSAACTHMGCLVQWQASTQKFVCPCHGGLFTEYGKPDPQSPMPYLIALPRLNTKVENGKIYVEVPGSSSDPSPTTSTSQTWKKP